MKKIFLCFAIFAVSIALFSFGKTAKVTRKLNDDSYESYGLYHNKGLDYIFNNGVNKDNYRTHGLKLLNQFMIENNSNEAGLISNTNAFDQNCMNILQTPIEDLLKNSVADGTITENFQNKELQLFSTMSEIDDLIDGGVDKQEALYKVVESISELEKEVLSEKTLSPQEEELFVISSSIGRNSLSYWIDNFERIFKQIGYENSVGMSFSKEGGHLSGPSQPKALNNLYKFSWGSVGKSDVKGAVAFGIAGGIGGAVFGPGALVGAGAGAISGGVGCSLYSIFDQLW